MSRRAPRVLVVGEAITAFMGYPGEPALTFHGPFPSGAPVIFASAAARLGVGVDLAAGIGADIFGDQFRERLVHDGVSVELLVVDRDRPTACAFVTYAEDGARTYIFYLDGTAAMGVDPSILDKVPRPDWVHVSGTTLGFGGSTAETAARTIEMARRNRIPLSFDPNVRGATLAAQTRVLFDAAFAAATVVLASEGELEALGVPQADLTGRGVVVCHKRGAKGVRIVTPERSEDIPAPPAREVDPDGAGDIFAAGYVAAAMRRHPPAVCARVGVRVASASVEVMGPLESAIAPLEAYVGGDTGR